MENNNCLFCESKKIDFTCEKCKSSFCINHMETTEKWICKKHEDVIYSKAKAQEIGERCTVLDNSKCPECGSSLMEDRLSSGQYYLKCTNPECGWNSYLKTPGLFFNSREQLAREANRYELVKGYKKCGKKLKYISGKEICPNCFLSLLRRATVTNFSTIMNSFNITADQMIKLINKYIEEERIYGIIDKVNQIFYYISNEMREKIMERFQEKGIVNVPDLASMLDMSREMAIQVVYKLINKYQTKGAFAKDKNHYYTQKYISDILIKKIDQKGRIPLSDLAKELSLPVELIKNYVVNILRSKTISAYLADKGNEVLTTDKMQREIIDYAKQVGIFKLSKLAQKLNIALELARRSLHEMIKSGGINGLFTQRREFMTIKHLETKIKEFAKAYRNMPLRELSNRLGVTESSIEENLALLIGKGEIDGYIDSQKRLFVAYSVSSASQHDQYRPSPQPAQKTPNDEDKIEVLRDYDFVGGQLHFKVVVRNNSSMAINNIKVVLDVPTSYKVKQPLIQVPVIEPGNSRGVDFYLEPKECGISNLSGTVIYKNAVGKQSTIPIRTKEVQIKCPLVCNSLTNIEDCQLAIQSLPNDARAFLIADLDPRLAFRAAIRTMKNFETSTVTSYEGGDASSNYEGEAWFCAEAKVTGGRIITRIFVSAASQSLEVRVWCANPGQLTGFLAKIIELLFEEINIIRKIKSEEREKTIDVMAITQNLAEVSDYCMLRWKAQNIRTKMHDTFVRLRKVLGDDNPILSRIEFWLTRLNTYGKDDSISEEDADKLVNDVENFRNVIARSIKL